MTPKTITVLGHRCRLVSNSNGVRVWKNKARGIRVTEEVTVVATNMWWVEVDDVCCGLKSSLVEAEVSAERGIARTRKALRKLDGGRS